MLLVWGEGRLLLILAQALNCHGKDIQGVDRMRKKKWEKASGIIFFICQNEWIVTLQKLCPH